MYISLMYLDHVAVAMFYSSRLYIRAPVACSEIAKCVPHFRDQTPRLDSFFVRISGKANNPLIVAGRFWDTQD